MVPTGTRTRCSHESDSGKQCDVLRLFALSCVKLLFERRVLTSVHRRQCPVVEAARFGHLDVLRFSVKVAGFDVNATGEAGRRR